MEETGLTTGNNHTLIIGGSAGSLAVIMSILSHLGHKQDLSVIIVVHRKSDQDSILAEVIQSKTGWKTVEADEKEEIKPGIAYLAPANYHLLIERDRSFALDDSEKVNFSRPSIDVSFESAADVFGEELIAVLLSGASADGVQGLIRVKESGGISIVQSPESAEISYMPEQAIKHAPVDFILHADEIGRKVTELCGE
jgi:two-component system chemotaxis response regulator CheB